jgi:hypothetical protein
MGDKLSDPTTSAHDPVNPAHYADLGEYSALHVTEKWGMGYHLGQTLKYIQRAGKRPDQPELTDLRKARWYLQRYIHLLAPEDEFDPAFDREPERWSP